MFKLVKTHYTIIAIGLLVLFGFLFFMKKPAQHIEIADTPAERERGLSGRTSLEPGHGMLFIFPEKGVYGFWMKGMLFPIDIVWLDDNRCPIAVETAVSPETYPKLFFPPVPVRYVLEIGAQQFIHTTFSDCPRI